MWQKYIHPKPVCNFFYLYKPASVTGHIYVVLFTPMSHVALTRSIVAIQVNFLKTELFVEIYSKSLDRAFSKVLLTKSS